MGAVPAGGIGQARLIDALRNPALYGAASVRVIETHISYVLLTGRYAFKIKKAVDLGFLNFSTLEARRFYCERELQLNRRFAADIYLDVVPIRGTAENPQLSGEGPVIEYALRMRQFPQHALLTDLLDREALTPDHVDELAARLASFHSTAERIRSDARYGTAADVRALALENFASIDSLLAPGADRGDLTSLCAWTTWEHDALAAWFDERRLHGFVRACHGDLHLGNIALVDGAVTMFDGIEFNERMRWSDVIADVAFLVMDLRHRRQAGLSARLLNAYLEHTGDYHGARGLRFYAAYRAMVRAKVARLRAAETTDAVARAACEAEFRAYVQLALGYTRPSRAAVIITHGPSGSGKTTVSQGLLEVVGGIRIRTDVERKRTAGVAATATSHSALDAGLYGRRETEETYARVRALAQYVVSGGCPAIIDGAFLQRWQRASFRELAAALDVPFVIVDFTAPPEILRARVTRRLQSGVDASEADVRVLEKQLRSEALESEEKVFVVTYDATVPPEHARQPAAWQEVVDRLGRWPSAA